jgi:antitoxin component YwqK of YwqJK toxin-antitoxin module
MGEVEIERGNRPSGQLWYERSYMNGKLHGLKRGWYEDGQLKYKLPYVNRRLRGLLRWWNKNGQLDFFSIWSKNTRKITIKFKAASIKNTTNKPLFAKELWKQLK